MLGILCEHVRVKTMERIWQPEKAVKFLLEHKTEAEGGASSDELSYIT